MTQPSRTELIEKVQAVLDAIADARMTEAEQDLLIDELCALALDPQITNYIFWPDRPMSAEEISDRALAYRPREAGWTP